MATKSLIAIFAASNPVAYLWTLLCLVLLLVPLYPAQSALALTDLTELRITYKEAERLLSQRKFSAWRKLKPKLQNYPLYPYLQLKELRAKGSKTRNSEVVKYLSKADMPLTPDFSNWWLNRLYKERNWELIVDHYADHKTIHSRCRYAEALYRSGKRQAALPVIEDLWLVGRSQDKTCDTVFGLALKSGLISDQLIFERLMLAYPRNRSLGKYLIGLLKSSEMKQWAQRLTRVTRNLRSEFQRNAKSWSQSKVGRDLIRFTIARLRLKDPKVAAREWAGARDSLSMSDDEKALIERDIAISLGTRHNPLAYEWFASLLKSAHNESSVEWWARTAILTENWHGLREAIATMSDAAAQRSIWKFWRAHALEKLGKSKEAREIWKDLSVSSDYYGFLSADLLGLEYSQVSMTSHHSVANHFDSKNHSAIARILEFLALGRYYSARSELYALSEVNDDEFWWNASNLFHQLRWHDGAIRAFRRTSNPDSQSIDLLYPRPYLSIVREASMQHSVPSQWIYGIMRQESLFVPDIKSGAGAVGLMQLLPSTAKSEAKRQELKAPTKRGLQNPKTNIRLGTGYLKRVLSRFDGNVVFALCGYNAGPSNLGKWRKSSTAKDALAWVETIPFRETRRYVKLVLANFIIYERLLEPNNSRITDYLDFI